MTAANNPNFNPEKYTTIASNHLVVYSIHTLHKDGDEISAEDIISACFTLFPKKFSLRTYPHWPDSALIGRRLHDCERSGWLIARINTGFKLTAKGNRLAEKVAKELGVAIPRKEKPVVKLRVDKLQVTETAKPAPIKSKPGEEAKAPVVEAPKPVEKTDAPVAKPAPVKPKPEENAKVLVIEAPKPVEKVITPVTKPAPVKPEEKAKAPVVEAPKPVKKVVKPVAKPAPIKSKPAKKIVKSVVKITPAKSKAKAPVVKAPKPVKKIVTPAAKPAPAKPKPAEKKAVAPVTKPAPVKPKVEKAKEKRVADVKVAETVKVVETSKAKVVPPSTVHRPPSVIPTVSAEEKARAGKFVKMMEASDAYRLYKKNGANANIGEFDFRSLLLCTMESSHETLVRNVELFKGYAGIHNRQDLNAFLGFCAEKFAHLLVPEKKAVRKLR